MIGLVMGLVTGLGDGVRRVHVISHILSSESRLCCTKQRRELISSVEFTRQCAVKVGVVLMKNVCAVSVVVRRILWIEMRSYSTSSWFFEAWHHLIPATIDLDQGLLRAGIPRSSTGRDGFKRFL